MWPCRRRPRRRDRRFEQRLDLGELAVSRAPLDQRHASVGHRIGLGACGEQHLHHLGGALALALHGIEQRRRSSGDAQRRRRASLEERAHDRNLAVKARHRERRRRAVDLVGIGARGE
jgi:hypothetical protein